MKKLMVLTATFAAAMTLCAATETVDGYTWTYRINGDTAEIYNSSWTAAISPDPIGTVTIPSTLGGKTVTSVGNYAFYTCDRLTGVIFGNSVTNIGYGAFYGCSVLASVELPSSLKSLGNECFYNCSVLPSITIPAGVARIPSRCFDNCSSLRLVSLPDTITDIGDYAFRGCSSLTSIALPAKLKTIGAGVFSQSGLQSVWMPDSVISIGESAFSSCDSLHGIRLSNGLLVIGEYAFSGAGLESIMIPATVVSLGSGSFNCSYYVGSPYYEYRYLTNVVFQGGAPAGIEVSKILEHAQSVYYPMTFATSYMQYVNESIFAGYAEGLDMGGGTVCTVTFNANGGTVPEPSRSVSVGSAVGALPVATRGGYTFLGWFVTANGSAQISASTVVSANVTWYAHWAENGSGSGGDSGGVDTPSVIVNDCRYELSNEVKDRAIVAVTVNGDCSIDEFVLTEGKVYDCVLYINNTSYDDVTLTLPAGKVYKAFKGMNPLSIPARSQHILTITRLSNRTFLVSREEVETLQQ